MTRGDLPLSLFGEDLRRLQYAGAQMENGPAFTIICVFTEQGEERIGNSEATRYKDGE